MQIVVTSPFEAERRALHELLQGDGHEIASVATRSEAIALARADHVDVIIIDAQLAGSAEFAASCPASTRVIFLCSRAVEPREGIACLTKPIDLGELRRIIMTPRLGQVA